MLKKVLSEEQIRKLLEKPAHSKTLEKAISAQALLEQHYSNNNKELVYSAVQPLLTAQKYARFKQVYKNHAQTVVNKIERHYGKVFEAFGNVTTIDIVGNPTATQQFKEQLETIFSGQSDEDYFKQNAVKHALIEPNSVYIVGSTLDENNDIQLKAKHIKVKDIHDIETDKSGVQYIIIKHGEERKPETRYFVYDCMNYSVWKQTSSGFMLDDEYTAKLTPHGNTCCPATFSFHDDVELDNNSFKKSILWDSSKDLLEYSILRTFYSYYKYFSAFGRDIKPQTRCNYSDKNNNVSCNGFGTLQPIDQSSIHKGSGTSCPNCAGKNKDVWGEIVEIPINQQTNEVLINNYSKLNFRIEADTNILEFHSDDVVRLKQEITNDVIGEGYGKSYNNQAVNEDQVRSNFDDQESNLTFFKTNIEKTWEFILCRAVEIFTPESEYIINKRLGDKYFLKSTEQLYQELESLYKGTSNSALIEQKQTEILLTENKNDVETMQRYQIVKALKPYSTFPLTYIEKNRVSLSLNQLRMYDNFDQVMTIFESRNGKLEGMVIDQTNIGLVITNLNSIFNEILNEIVQEDEQTGNEEPPEGS